MITAIAFSLQHEWDEYLDEHLNADSNDKLQFAEKVSWQKDGEHFTTMYRAFWNDEQLNSRQPHVGLCGYFQ